MFENREPSIFPHPASARWIPVLLVLGWAPLWLSDILGVGSAEGFAMPWGIGVTISGTALAVVSLPVQGFRLLMYFLNRSKPTPEPYREPPTRLE
jgi:hypothetical protein